jgi:hypothetical protein
MDRRGFLAGALALGGCAAAGRGPHTIVTAATTPFAELEPLYRADAGRDGLTISVGSNGCTTKADFAVHLSARPGGAAQLAFGRRRIDPCKSFARGRTDLTFSWAELGVPAQGPVALLNPLVAWRGP